MSSDIKKEFKSLKNWDKYLISQNEDVKLLIFNHKYYYYIFFMGLYSIKYLNTGDYDSISELKDIKSCVHQLFIFLSWT